MSIIQEIDAFHVVVISLVLGIGMLIPPTRAILVFAFGLIWAGVVKATGMIFTLVHEASVKLWEAHVCWLKNWRPRQMVIPSLRRERSTRRTD
jgi:hypothetical protein